MSGRPARETILAALLNALTSEIEFQFLADTAEGSNVLQNAVPLGADSSDTADSSLGADTGDDSSPLALGADSSWITADSSLTADDGSGALFLGLPVIGGSIPRGAVITQLWPLTISLPAGATEAGVTLSTGFQTSGRRVLPWKDVNAQPAVFVRDPDEEFEYSNILGEQTIRAEIWIYSDAGRDPDLAPGVALNWLLDAVTEGAMAPDDPMTGRFTLGGLVDWCRVRRVTKQPGDLNGQAKAVIDVDIIVP